MSELLEYLYTTLTRLFDWLTYPLDMLSNAIDFISGSWSTVTASLSMFPVWSIASLTAILALGIVLFGLQR